MPESYPQRSGRAPHKLPKRYPKSCRGPESAPMWRTLVKSGENFLVCQIWTFQIRAPGAHFGTSFLAALARYFRTLPGQPRRTSIANLPELTCSSFRDPDALEPLGGSTDPIGGSAEPWAALWARAHRTPRAPAKTGGPAREAWIPETVAPLRRQHGIHAMPQVCDALNFG